MKWLLELVVLLILMAFGGLLYLFNFTDPESDLNNQLRPVFLKTDLSRKVFNLNQVGDARLEYLNPKTQEILVEVNYAPAYPPHPQLENWLKEMVEETTGKPVKVTITAAPTLNDPAGYDDEQLGAFFKSLKKIEPEKGQGYIHLLYVAEHQEFPSNAGRTLGANEMAIFKRVILGLSSEPIIRARLEESTLKHEFGHLLGLPHTEDESCLMAESVEVYEKRRLQGGNLPLKHCPESLRLLEEFRLMAE